MKEWLQLGALVSGSVCFAIGGMHGGRIVRRYILPLLLAGFAYLLEATMWKCISSGLVLMVSLHLGYGEKVPWWRKALVWLLYSASTLFFGFTVWQVISPIAMACLFILSNFKGTSSSFFWKGVEFFWGALIAVTMLGAING